MSNLDTMYEKNNQPYNPYSAEEWLKTFRSISTKFSLPKFPLPEDISECFKPIFSVISNLWSTSNLNHEIIIYPTKVISKNIISLPQKIALRKSLATIYDHNDYLKGMYDKIVINKYSKYLDFIHQDVIDIELKNYIHAESLESKPPDVFTQAIWAVWFEDNYTNVKKLKI